MEIITHKCTACGWLKHTGSTVFSHALSSLHDKPLHAMIQLPYDKNQRSWVNDYETKRCGKSDKMHSDKKYFESSKELKCWRKSDLKITRSYI